MYCLNCGEDWYNCICIPWCNTHDVPQPCATCAREWDEHLANQNMLKPYITPWYKLLWFWIIGKRNE